MENIPLPSKVTIEAGEKPNEGIISIQPCFPGYGTTIGNALRRVLISSLPGAAVVSFKIKGVSHEFSAIDNVKEDVVEIALNLKQLRLKVHSDEPVRLTLKASGEKEVKAKDIKTTSDVEIANGDLTVATLTDKSAELEMEIVVSKGRGYVPTESREDEETEVDMINVDSIFTPLKKVGIDIQNVRVGQMTNYEKVVLSIETDGTITPEEALKQATEILLNHFNLIADELQGDKKTAQKASKDDEEAKEETEEAKEDE